MNKPKLTKKPQVKKTKVNPKAIAKDVLQEREDILNDKGIVFLDNDTYLNVVEDSLQLPSDITEVDSKSLGNLLNVYTQHKVHYRTILGRLEMKLDYDKKRLQLESKDIYRELSFNNKLSESAKEQLMSTDAHISPFYDKYVESKSNVSLVAKAISNFEDIIFMISRELTRRNTDNI